MNGLLSPLNPLKKYNRETSMRTLPSSPHCYNDYNREARRKHNSLMLFSGVERKTRVVQSKRGQVGRNSLDLGVRDPRGARTPSEKLKKDIATLDCEIGEIQMKLEGVLCRKGGE